jgi:hypothetical protein
MHPTTSRTTATLPKRNFHLFILFSNFTNELLPPPTLTSIPTSSTSRHTTITTPSFTRGFLIYWLSNAEVFILFRPRRWLSLSGGDYFYFDDDDDGCPLLGGLFYFDNDVSRRQPSLDVFRPSGGFILFQQRRIPLSILF